MIYINNKSSLKHTHWYKQRKHLKHSPSMHSKSNNFRINQTASDRNAKSGRHESISIWKNNHYRSNNVIILSMSNTITLLNALILAKSGNEEIPCDRSYRVQFSHERLAAMMTSDSYHSPCKLVMCIKHIMFKWLWPRIWRQTMPFCGHFNFTTFLFYL